MINCFFSLRPYSTMELFPLNYIKKTKTVSSHTERFSHRTQTGDNVKVFCPMLPDIRKKTSLFLRILRL
jgi:hypothetical protein